MDLRYVRVGTALAVLWSGAAGVTGVSGVRAEAGTPSSTEQAPAAAAAPAAPAAAAGGLTPRGVADIAALAEADHSSAIFLVDGITPAVFILRTPASPESGKAVALSAFATFASDPSWGRSSAPSSLDVSGRSLIVSDVDGRVLAQLTVPSPPPAATPTADAKAPYMATASSLAVTLVEATPRVVQPPVKPSLPPGLKGLPSSIQDFDVHRGVYYIASASGLFAIAPRSDLILPIKLDGGISDEGVKVAVSSVHLVVGDGPKRRVHIHPRPVPTVVSLEKDASASSVQLLNLYDVLRSRDFLPLREHRVQRPLTLEQTLIGERVLLASVAKENVDPAVLKRMTCLYSPQACSRKGNATLSLPLNVGDVLRLPDLAIDQMLTTGLVNLAGRSIREHLGERVLDAKQLDRVDPEYLTRINSSSVYSLEDRLTRLGFTVATPWRAELTPLTFVQVKDGREELLPGLAAECKLTAEHVPITAANTPLGEFEAERGSPSRYLQAYMPDAPVRGKAGVDENLVAFESLGIDQVNLQTLRARLASPDVADCLEDKVPKGAGLIIRSLRASRVLFQQNSAASRQAGPKASTVLAYQLAPWEDIAKAGAADVRHVAVQPWLVKPGSAQDPFERRVGVVWLPVTRWQVKALVPARDLADPQSAIRRFEEASTGFHVLSTQSIETKSSAADVQCDPATRAIDPDTEKLLVEARKQFIAAIKYDDAFARQVSDPIGLGEKLAGVDHAHPAFLDSGKRSAWLRGVEDTGFEPFVVDASAGKTPAASVKRFCNATDHGTHVAGLLAARTGPLAGLLPSASLYLIDTSSEAGLYQTILDAKNRGIFLFNFSFTVPHDPSLIPLRKKMREDWSDRLFIVAAGNEGRDLADGADPLVGWSSDIGHIIGVGAADADGRHVLSDWPDEDNQTRKGSNFGPQVRAADRAGAQHLRTRASQFVRAGDRHVAGRPASDCRGRHPVRAACDRAPAYQGTPDLHGRLEFRVRQTRVGRTPQRAPRGVDARSASALDAVGENRHQIAACDRKSCRADQERRVLRDQRSAGGAASQHRIPERDADDAHRQYVPHLVPRPEPEASRAGQRGDRGPALVSGARTVGRQHEAVRQHRAHADGMPAADRVDAGLRLRGQSAPIRQVLAAAGICVALIAPAIASGQPIDVEKPGVRFTTGRTIAREHSLFPLQPGLGVVYVQSVGEPNVRSFRVHFTVRQTADPAWTVRIRDRQGQIVWVYAPTGPDDRDFWSDDIPGDAATIQILASTPGLPLELAVDKLLIPVVTTVPQGTTSPRNDLAPIANQSPQIVGWGRAVALLRITGDDGEGYPCTGFLITADLMLTNHHCIHTSTEMQSAFIDFDYDRDGATETGLKFAELLLPNAELDYTLLRLRARTTRTPLKLRGGTLEDEHDLLIIQHAAGTPKRVSIQDCEVRGPSVQGASARRTDFGHWCDTLGGSSGSPIQDIVSGDVVGLHHFGFREGERGVTNRGVHIGLILDDIKERKKSVFEEIVPQQTAGR